MHKIPTDILRKSVEEAKRKMVASLVNLQRRDAIGALTYPAKAEEVMLDIDAYVELKVILLIQVTEESRYAGGSPHA